MKQSVEMLLDKMTDDKEFAEKILSQTDNEQAIKVAGEAGIKLTRDDIEEANEIIAKSLEFKDDSELSEEELESVAGGLFDNSMVTVSRVSVDVSAKVRVSLIRISKQWDMLISGPHEE